MPSLSSTATTSSTSSSNTSESKSVYLSSETRIRKGRSIGTLWDELVSIIPYPDFLNWFLQQLAINPDMQKFINQLKTKETQKIKDWLLLCPDYLAYRCWMIEGGVDIVSVEEKGCSFLEW